MYSSLLSEMSMEKMLIWWDIDFRNIQTEIPEDMKSNKKHDFVKKPRTKNRMNTFFLVRIPSESLVE